MSLGPAVVIPNLSTYFRALRAADQWTDSAALIEPVSATFGVSIIISFSATLFPSFFTPDDAANRYAVRTAVWSAFGSSDGNSVWTTHISALSYTDILPNFTAITGTY